MVYPAKDIVIKKDRPTAKRKITGLGNLQANIGAIVLLVIVIAAMAASGGYDNQDLASRLKPPFWTAEGSISHLAGTDSLGRDVFARLLYGARVSILVAATGVIFGGSIGVFLGVVSGFFGGRVDAIIMRLADIQLAFPYILLAIAIVAVLGPSFFNLILVLGLRSWVIYARTVRGSVLSVRELDYVLASLASGASVVRVLGRHVVPNILAPIIVISTVEFANLILIEATLSFLGFGVQPPYPSWGSMLADGRAYIGTAWWLTTFPGLMIMLAVIGANLLGDGLRDKLDPRLRTE